MMGRQKCRRREFCTVDDHRDFTRLPTQVWPQNQARRPCVFLIYEENLFVGTRIPEMRISFSDPLNQGVPECRAFKSKMVSLSPDMSKMPGMDVRCMARLETQAGLAWPCQAWPDQAARPAKPGMAGPGLARPGLVRSGPASGVNLFSLWRADASQRDSPGVKLSEKQIQTQTKQST